MGEISDIPKYALESAKESLSPLLFNIVLESGKEEEEVNNGTS